MREQTQNPFWTVDLSVLPKEDAKFYLDDADKSAAWRRAMPCIKEYRERYICGEVAIFDCMDERQANTPETLGLPLGVSTPIRSAGNLLGEYNRNVESEILRLSKRQRRSLRPGEDPRPVMALFVTHSSQSRPHDDSCAAWAHKTDRACEEATRQVARMNRDYLALGCDGNPLRRFVAAFHLHAHTDTEANIWHGQNLQLDPMSYVAGPQGDPRRIELRNELLEADILESFRMAFPFHDPRFTGLTRDDWERVIRQIGDMFEANVVMVRRIASGQAEASKQGHQGRRVLVGRGWEVYDETYESHEANFTVSDFTKLDRDIGIAGKYVLANSVMAATRNGNPVCVPYHVNVLYGGWDDLNRQADRCVSARLGMGIGRDILAYWRRLSQDTSLRTSFRLDVTQVIDHKGGGKKENDLLIASCRDAATFMKNFRVYVSVSYHDTHALELVATTEDVSNS